MPLKRPEDKRRGAGMGVTGLWELLNRAGKKCELAQLANRRLAVDTSVWLVQFVKGMRTEDGGPLENAHLRGLFSRLCKLLYYGIRPVFVFDGGKPTLKMGTLEMRQKARRKAESSVRSLARELLLQRVKKRVLLLKDAAGRPLGEAEVRQMLAALEAKAQEIEQVEEADDDHDGMVTLPPIRSRPQDMTPLVRLELEQRQKLDMKLREYEQVAEHLPVQQSGLMFSALQLESLVGSLKKRERDEMVVEGRIASDPSRGFRLIKGPVEDLRKKPKTDLLFVSDDMLFTKDSHEVFAEFDDDDDNDHDNLDHADPVIGQEVTLMAKGKEEEWESSSSSSPSASASSSWLPSLAFESSTVGAVQKVNLARVEEEEKEAEVVAVADKEDALLVDEFLDAVEMESQNSDEEDNMDGADDLDEQQEDEEEADPSDLSVLDDEGRVNDSVFASAPDPQEWPPMSFQPSSSEEDTAMRWECPLCSYRNTFALARCQVCSGARETLRSKSGADAVSHSVNYIAPGNEHSEYSEEVAAAAATAAGEEPRSSSLAALSASISAREQELIAAGQAGERMAEGVDHLMMQESKDLLMLFGVPWIDAPMEAEAQCAELEMLHLVDGVVTEDSDVFLVGAVNVYKNLFRSAHHPQHYRMSDVTATLGMDRNTLIQLAYLLGSDYTVGIHGVGIVLAVEILGEFRADDEDAVFGDDESLRVEKCIAPLVRFRDWLADTSSPRAKGLRRRLLKVSLPVGFPDRAVAQAYLSPDVDKAEDVFSWGEPKWEALKRFAVEKMQWTAERADEFLDPIADRLAELKTSGSISQKTMLEFFTAQGKEIPLQVNSARLARAIAKFKGEAAADAADQDAAASRKSKAKRTAKPKQAPKRSKRRKRARSAYSFFLAEKSKEIRLASPDMPFSELSKSCAAQWALLKDRSRFTELAKKDREMLELELEAENDDDDDDDDDEFSEAGKDNVDDGDGSMKQDEVHLFGEEASEGKVSDTPLSLENGPPFDRRLLKSLKMNELRLLCHRYRLKPSVRKADVIDQLSMLTAIHQPVSREEYEKKLSRGGRKTERKAVADLWDEALDHFEEHGEGE